MTTNYPNCTQCCSTCPGDPCWLQWVTHATLYLSITDSSCASVNGLKVACTFRPATQNWIGSVNTLPLTCGTSAFFTAAIFCGTRPGQNTDGLLAQWTWLQVGANGSTCCSSQTQYDGTQVVTETCSPLSWQATGVLVVDNTFAVGCCPVATCNLQVSTS